MKNKFSMLVLSIVIAFSLWMYVVLVVNPESEQTYYNIPVVLDGTSALSDRDLMITSDTNYTVTLKLSGNRTDLNKLDSSNITILADLSQITEAGEYNIKYSVSYPGSVQSGNIEELERSAQYVTVVVAERVQKEIPVKLEHTGTLPDNYSADLQNAVLDRTTMTVSGPKDVIDRIDYAKITVDLTDQTANIVNTYRPTLCDRSGQIVTDVSQVTASVSEIRASVKVSMLKTISIRAEVIAGGGMVAEDISYTLDRASIVVSGAQSALEYLNEIVVTIDLSKLTESQKLIFDIKLPDGVTNVTGVSQVTADVQVPEMTTRTLTVTAAQFSWSNVPDNTDIAILTEQLQITVRGRENRLEELTAENITVVVDFTDALIGSADYFTATVRISGVSNVGAVGEYTVWASVTAQTGADNPEA